MKVQIRITETGLVYCNMVFGNTYKQGYVLCKGWTYQDSRCVECPLRRIKECLKG